MNWKDIEPGLYVARITDYGLEEIAQLNNAIKVVITLDVFTSEGVEAIKGKWEGFIATKDGQPNQKTMKTLATCGMKSDELMDLATKPDMLDKEIDLEVQVIQDGQYKRIEWINRPGGMALIKKSVPKTRPGVAFKAALAAARFSQGAPIVRPPVINHADKITNAKSFDDASEIPF